MAEHNRHPFFSADREDAVLRIIGARRARARIFGAELFSDPGWDILLCLFVARLRQQRPTIAQLSRDVALSANLTARWMDTLDQSGLLHLRVDPSDRQRIFVELSKKGVEAMTEWVDALRDTGPASNHRVIDLLSRIRDVRE